MTTHLRQRIQLTNYTNSKIMYLVKTSLEGTTFNIQFITDQENKAPVTVDLSKNKIIGDPKIMTKFPIGTTFIVSDIAWGEVSSKINGSIRPLYFEEQVFSITLPPDNIPSNADVNYLIDWMIASPEFTKESVKMYAQKFIESGYTVDIENKIAAFKEDKSGSLREQIMRQYPCPTEKEIGFHIEPDTWYLLVRNVLRRESVMIIGPTGSGKTELVKHLATAMSKPLSIQDMGTVQDAQSALLGVHRLNKDGHSEFDYAPFVGHIQKDGIVLLDELNRAPLSASNILFPCLDGRRYLPLDVAGADGLRNVPVHENCVFFATANIGSEYSGTTQIDRALLDRFFPIELSYPSEAAETKILQIRTGVDAKSAKAIVKVSKTIRTEFKNQELSNVVSVRHTLLAASLIKDGFDILGALNAVIMPLFDDSNGVSERTKIKSIIAAN